MPSDSNLLIPFRRDRKRDFASGPGADLLASGSALRQAAAFGGSLITLAILLGLARRRGGTSPPRGSWWNASFPK